MYYKNFSQSSHSIIKYIIIHQNITYYYLIINTVFRKNVIQVSTGLGVEWVTVIGVLNLNSIVYYCTYIKKDSKRK